MAIPDFQALMLPLIELCRDRKEHVAKELVSSLAEQFGLTEEERMQPLPSGGARLFANRVGWALSHLKMAQILENPKRGVYKLTARGLGVLHESPHAVNMKFLHRFPEYAIAKKGGSEGGVAVVEGDASAAKPPQEVLEEAYHSMAAVLATELLEKIRACSPWFFQKIVKDLLIKMGYGGTPEDVERSVTRGADEGIDGIINQDRLGLERVYIQAKRWGDSIGRPEVQKFAGALQGQQAHKGVFITTSAFSKEAQEYAGKIPTKIVLVDGELLAQLMIEHGVGTATVKTYEIKQIDSDYFVEE